MPTEPESESSESRYREAVVNKHRVIGVLALFCMATSCATTPSSLEETMLAPRAAPTGNELLTFDEVVPVLDVDPNELDMEALSKTVILGGREGDSLVAVMSLWEYDPMLYLDVWLYNMSSQGITIGPRMAQLVDGMKTQFRRLDPHEAAQIYASQVRGIPPYEAVFEPKTKYEVSGYSYGNYTEATVREVPTAEESGRQLGYAIGAFIRRKRNEKLRNAAAYIYSHGLVPGTEVGSDAALQFGVFWLNTPQKTYPLELRLLDSTIEIQFQQPEPTQSQKSPPPPMGSGSG